MGQASPGVNGYGTVTGQPRFRVPDCAPSLDDQIKRVAEAVQAVLAEHRGQSRYLSHWPGMASTSGVSIPPHPGPPHEGGGDGIEALPPRGGGLGGGADKTRPTEADYLARWRKDPDCQVVVGKLFSARHVEALPPGTRTIQVAPGTVVTPVARDMLKRLGVAIRLMSSSHSLMASAHGEWAFAIDTETGTTQAVAEGTARRPSPLGRARVFARSGHRMAARGVGTRGHADHGRTRRSRSGGRARSRESGPRRPSSPPTSAARSRRLGVNLLVVEPAGKSISWMKQLGDGVPAGRGARGPRRACARREGGR